MRLFVVLFFVPLFTGCSLLGSGTSCDEPLPSPAEQHVVLRLEMNGDCKTYPEKVATFNPEAIDPANRRAFFAILNSPGERGTTVFLARRGTGVPKAGTYSLANLTEANPPYPGQFETYPEQLSLVGLSEEWEGGPAAYTTSGTVTINASDEDRLIGSFEAEAEVEGTGEVVRLSGRFDAFRYDFPWQSW